MKIAVAIFYVSVLLSLEVIAEPLSSLNITKGLRNFEVEHVDDTVKIERNQNPDATITLTAPACPETCVQPIEAAPGVKTIGLYELVEFMQNDLAVGAGLLIDARTPNWYQQGTIPGSINIPYTTLSTYSGANEIDIADALEQLGGKELGESWDFSNSPSLVLWCNGSWCGQSPAAIRGLLRLGFPVNKIHYFRGGLEAWKRYGLNVIVL